MPAARKVRWAQLRVGFMAIVAMAIAASLILLLTSQKPLWQSDVPIYTYMDDSAALAKGSPVRLNGILIGSVERVELSGSRAPGRAVRVVMQVQRERLKDVPIDSFADISAENVLGAKFINITMGKSNITVQPNGEVRSEPNVEIQDLVKRGFGIFDSAQAILGRIDQLVGLIESGKGSLGKFLVDEEFYNQLVKTITELHEVTSTLSSGKGTIGRLLYDESLYNEAQASLAKLDQVISDLQAGQGSAGKLLKDPALYDETRASVEQVRKLLEDLNAGKGTAGKLLKDEAAYNQIQGVLGKFDTTLDKVNSGQGTIGQLMANPQLYDSVNGLSKELHELIKDIRANPKKFLRVRFSIF